MTKETLVPILEQLSKTGRMRYNKKYRKIFIGNILRIITVIRNLCFYFFVFEHGARLISSSVIRNRKKSHITNQNT